MSRRRKNRNRNKKPQRLEKKMIYYRQCKLQKGMFHTTSWIPEKYAVMGKHVQLKKKGLLGKPVWDNGWKVVEVRTRKKEKEVLVRSQDYKHQRKASDV